MSDTESIANTAQLETIHLYMHPAEYLKWNVRLYVNTNQSENSITDTASSLSVGDEGDLARNNAIFQPREVRREA